MPPKRKKWTEEEERTLMDKYAEMAADGSLRRLRTREHRFRPIAAHVNSAHHLVDSSLYPHLWSWKDASTKVQNMRHQYLLVKQKLLSGSGGPGAAVDWAEGLALWPNFLRYRQVFGDHPLKTPSSDGNPETLAIPAEDGDLGLGLGFDCAATADDADCDAFDYDDVAPPPPPPPVPLPQLPVGEGRLRRRGRRKGWGALAAEVGRMREWEARAEERDRRRREEERVWEERMERRRANWRKQTEEMLARHRAEMDQIQARVLHDQQSIISQLLSIVSHWASPGNLANGNGINGTHDHHEHQQEQHHQHPYVSHMSHMMQGLHHVNGIVPGESRGGGDGDGDEQEDQFIVDD